VEKKIVFICNDKEIIAKIHPAVTVLDFLRQNLSLTGTKEGCREGDCGACTVLVGELVGNKVVYKSVNSCLLPIDSVKGKHIVTIEGLNGNGLSPIQSFMVEEGGTQCGFCTPGFIISMTGYFLTNDKYDKDGAIDALDGNICRCTGHTSIKRAAVRSVEYYKEHKSESLIKSGLVPAYFSEIPSRLKELKNQIGSNGVDGKSVKYNIGGGTDLYVQKWDDLYKSDVAFILVPGDGELISVKNDECIISASATVSDIMNSEIMVKYFHDIKKYFSLFGSLPIRNRATLGGNIVNASPIADMTNFFLALNAKVLLVDNHQPKERSVYLKDFFIAYKTLDLKPGEMIKSLSFNLPSISSLFSYEKVSRRTYLDIASVNTSMYIETNDGVITNIHLSAGGVAPIPKYLTVTRDFLLNRKIDPEVISESAQVAISEISPISDARGSVEYKKLLLRQLIFAHFLKLFPELVNYEELV
jgi:xanthine dehydrogenase small subunit